MDHCYDSPCQNNATCQNQLENYTCTCQAEFTGQNCEGASLSLKMILNWRISYVSCMTHDLSRPEAISENWLSFFQQGIIAKTVPARTTELVAIF